MLAVVQNLSNHKHNCDVPRNADGVLIVWYPPKYPAPVDQYGQCENYCLSDSHWIVEAQMPSEELSRSINYNQIKTSNCNTTFASPKGY